MNVCGQHREGLLHIEAIKTVRGCLRWAGGARAKTAAPEGRTLTAALYVWSASSWLDLGIRKREPFRFSIKIPCCSLKVTPLMGEMWCEILSELINL